MIFMSSSEHIVKLRQTYNIIADDFSCTRKDCWKECIDFIEDIGKKQSVLDLGCGNGRNLITAMKKSEFCVGLDFSLGFLKIIRGKKGDVPLVAGEFLHLPFSEGSFDVVLFMAALHHLPEESQRLIAIEEMARVMRSGAVALVSVWAHEQEKYEDGAQDVDVMWRKKFPRFYHLFKKGELENLVSSVDSLKIVDSFRSGNNYFVKICKRKV